MKKKEFNLFVKSHFLSNWDKIEMKFSGIFLFKYFDSKFHAISINYSYRSNYVYFDSNMVAMVSFNEIEDAFIELNLTINAPNTLGTVYKVSAPDHSLGMPVSNIDELEKKLFDIEKIIYNEFQPFFEEYKSLEDVTRHVDFFNLDKIYFFICTPSLIKYLLIVEKEFHDKYEDEKVKVENKILELIEKYPNNRNIQAGIQPKYKLFKRLN